MNNDGWGQVGSGVDDNRLTGDDLQHYRQKKTSDESRWTTKRILTEPRESGGPMKKQKLTSRLDESLGVRDGSEQSHMQSMSDRRHESEAMTHRYSPLQEEKSRHEDAIKHHFNHLEKHYGRGYDSQYGHDTYIY